MKRTVIGKRAELQLSFALSAMLTGVGAARAHAQSLWMASQPRRARMRSGSCKILASVPVALFASSAFGTAVTAPPYLAPGYPATVDWVIGASQAGVQSGTQGIISAQNGSSVFVALFANNGVATFKNPSGPGTAKVIVDINDSTSVYAKAPSVPPSPPNSEDLSNFTSVQVGAQAYVQVLCKPESRNDLCSVGTRVPLSWEGNYALSGASGFYGADNQVSATVSGIWEFTKNCADACTSGVFTGSANVRPNEILHWTLGAGAYSLNGGPTGFAYIDPYFYLSPAEVADGYSLVFSEFVGNTNPTSVSSSPVPEPPSLMLFVTGVIFGGIALRRKRRWTPLL
jgi:hypothetical protein